MKRLTKILLVAGGAALICGASVMTYLKAQTQQPEMSDLTLQNLEAMAEMPGKLDFDLDDDQEKKYSYMRGPDCIIMIGSQAVKGYKPNCLSGFEYPVCADCVAK